MVRTQSTVGIGDNNDVWSNVRLSKHTCSETLGYKTKTNDELRQTFIDQIVPELQMLGLEIPDPDLKFDEKSGNWTIGKINWDEFWQVIKGHGPCNKERMEVRIKAHEDGRWVREAIQAYSIREANET
jgi:ring-1,2-phenylacetyl-CoA epoxidase subunit PaaA